jgi:tetratricopeptide (TPR) repeat protein
MLRFGIFALGVALIGWQAGRAEPTGPIPKAAKDRYAEAQELEKQGRTREAIAAYQDAIRLGMQTYPRAHLKEANGYLGLQDYDAAVTKYTKFIDNFGLEDSCRYWIRTAYSGRAAAYEKKGDYARALADYDMLVFSYAVELDLTDAKTAEMDDFLREAAASYRKRAACLRTLGALEPAAQRDIRRAEALEAKIKKVAQPSKVTAAGPPELLGRVTIHNGWTEPVTVVIAGVAHPFKVEETRTLAVPEGSSPCEIQSGSHRVKGTLESGGRYNIQPPTGAAP